MNFFRHNISKKAIRKLKKRQKKRHVSKAQLTHFMSLGMK